MSSWNANEYWTSFIRTFEDELFDTPKNSARLWTGYNWSIGETYKRWIGANKVTDIEHEMVSYNTLITKPSKEEIKKYAV